MKKYSQYIFEAASNGALILTANKRLFRHLREGYDRWMQEQGHKAWSTPQIFSYEGWLALSLDQIRESWQLLSPYQEQCLWEEQISLSSKGSSLELLQLPQTAEKALQAHHLISEYQLTLDEAALTEDQQMFLVWQQRYLNYCQRYGLFDKSAVPGKICSAIVNSEIPLPPLLLLVGFDQLSPGLKQLQQVASDRGGDCLAVDLISDESGAVICYAAVDKNDEIESAARWTRNLLEQGADSIGIVVPDLVRQRRKIERIFRQQIDPESVLISENDDTLFSLSLGGPLAEQGIIHAALEFLSVGHYLTIDQVSFLLRTPYLGNHRKESNSRALFDRKLRSYKQQRFSLSALISLAEKTSGLSGLVDTFTNLKNALKEQKKSPGQWAQNFVEQLKNLGWPGDRVISSSEFQAMKSWRLNVVEVLPTLDRILNEMTRTQGMTLLRRMTNDTDFQLESPNGQVQVVGLLESSGLTFQHVWVMGLEDRMLPAQPQPNPFIPYKLQEDHLMPRASVERELLFAEQVIERLKGASPDVVFSYPPREGDCFFRPSPLIADLSEDVIPQFAPYADPFHVSSFDRTALDVLDDHQGAPIEGTSAKGGTSLLKDQAHCPFRAYVHHRLQCRALDEAVPGIAAMARGDLVHLALENIWKHLEHQTRLLELNDPERVDMVHQQVEKAVADYFSKGTKPAEALIHLESERLENLLLDWLINVEMERDSFTVIATEQEIETEVGPLSIRLKVDRLDSLEDGCRIVIDYKTGSDLHADDFLSTPLIEPQLPVYAVSDPDCPADGVAFAQLRKGTCRFVGLVRHQGLLGNVKDLSRFSQTEELGINDWAELLAFWHREVHQLAEDFAKGKAEVKPFSQDKSCRYCDLSGICRIDEVVCLRGEENE
jgi:ATP-dependent helicase/nuclease subunit B